MRNNSLILNIILSIAIGQIGIQSYAQTDTETNNSELFQAVTMKDLNQVRTLLEAQPSLLAYSCPNWFFVKFGDVLP
jgi:hypothetical protein